MKFSILLLGMIMPFFLHACEREDKQDYFIISGKIMKYKDNMKIGLKKQVRFDFINNIEPDGTFSDTIYSNFGRYHFVHDSFRLPLYVGKGYNVHVVYDAENIDQTLLVTGSGAEIVHYFLAKEKQMSLFKRVNELSSLSEVDFKREMNRLKNEKINFLDNFEKLPNAFKRKERNDIHYNYLGCLDYYAKSIEKKRENKEVLDISENFFKERRALTYDNEEDFQYSDIYINMVFGYYQKESELLAQQSNISEDLAYVKAVSKNPSELIRNELLNGYVNRKFKYSRGITSNSLDELYNGFMSIVTNDEYKKNVTETYNKLLTLLPNKISPVFNNYENYNGGTTSLSDFKGEYVFIDVWATWCSSCLRELPHLKELEEEYHGKNIKFISISVDKSNRYDAWRAMIKKKEMGGIQLIADNNKNSQFIQEYNISLFPRFIVVDPQGYIVDSNAPKPSNKDAIKKLFNSLNIK